AHGLAGRRAEPAADGGKPLAWRAAVADRRLSRHQRRVVAAAAAAGKMARRARATFETAEAGRRPLRRAAASDRRDRGADRPADPARRAAFPVPADRRNPAGRRVRARVLHVTRPDPRAGHALHSRHRRVHHGRAALMDALLGFAIYVVITLFLMSFVFPLPFSDTGTVRYNTLPTMTLDRK